MRKSLKFGIGMGLFAALAACGQGHGSPSPESLSTQSSADSFDAGAVPSLPNATGHGVPFPGITQGTKIVDEWSGTPSELIVADALALCTVNAAGQARGSWVGDTVLRGLRAKMVATLGAIATATGTSANDTTNDLLSTSWLTMRVNPSDNFDPISQTPTAVAYTTTLSGWVNGQPVPGKYDPNYDMAGYTNAGSSGLGAYAQPALDVAEVNLCVGRTVNEQLQYGTTLLMSGADQRLLYETVRERAQLGMLQLSDIAVVLSNFPVGIDPTTLVLNFLEGKGGPSLVVDTLVAFVTNGTGPAGVAASTVVGRWASDLTDAARLQAKATETLSTLLVRSGAAQTFTPGTSSSACGAQNAQACACGVPGGPCDDLSPGSWRERALSLFYGGNPLDSATLPGAPGVPAIEKANAAIPALPWPSGTEIPYATHAIALGTTAAPPTWTPGAIQFMKIAQQFDTLTLLLNSSTQTFAGTSAVATGSTSGYAISDAAYWLYLDLEAAIETQACAPSALEENDAGSAVCPTVTAPSLVAPSPAGLGLAFPLSSSTPAHVPDLSKLAGWQAWQTYELRPEDAQQLVSALVAMLPSPSASGGLLLLGGSDVRTLPGRTASSLHLAKTASIMPHSLLEAATVYGRLGRHRLPQVLDDSPVLTALYAGYDDAQDGTLLDEGRAMGAVPALGELREALWAVNAGANPAGAVFKAQVSAISGLVTAAIGDGQTSLLPVESSLAVSGETTTVQATGPAIAEPGSLLNAPTRQWLVHVLPSAEDAETGGFWADASLSNYSVYGIIDNPQAMNAVADPVGVRAGFASLATILAATNGSVATGTTLVREASGVLSAVLDLPETVPGASTGHTVILVARHRAGHTYTYRALSGVVTPWAARALASDNVSQVPVPGDAQFFVTSGALTGLALRASSVSPTDPATPLFDGLGNPKNLLPTRSQLTISGTTAQPQLTWFTQTLALATPPLQSAATNLSTFLTDLKGTLTDQEKVQAAEQTELSSINKSLVTLCGGVAANVGMNGSLDVSDAGVVLPASGCNVSFVTINSMGPTVADLQSFGCTVTAGAPKAAPALAWPAAPADCAAPTSMQDRATCALAPYTKAFSFPVEVSLPVACAAYTRDATFGDGTLGQAISTQAAAYWAYRDSVNALQSAGLAFIAQAQAADAADATAKAAYVAEQAVAAASDQNLSAAVKSAMATVQADQKNVSDKTTDLNDLGVFSAGQALGAFAQGAGIGAAVGAGIGSVIPGLGTAIGGAVGALVGGLIGAIASIEGGPSQEQIDQAQDALDQANAQLTKDQLALTNDINAQDAGDQANAAQVFASGTAATGALAQSASVVAQGVASFTTQLVTVMSNGATLLSSGIPIHNDVVTTALDIQLAQLTYSQVVEAANVDYGIMAEFDANTTFALTADLAAARSSLIDARHLLEFTYAADFSSTTASLSGGVAAPNLWIDQVYDYDLSPLRAIYGSTGGPTGIIDGTKLTDYYNNLNQLSTDYQTENGAQAFLNGVQQEQFIAGPAAQTTVQVTTPTGVTTSSILDPGAGAWLVLCPSRAACAANGDPWCEATPGTGSFATVCASAVTNGETPTYYPPIGAKVRFTLDRWGYMTPPGWVPNQPPLEQGTIGALDGRWSRIGVVIIGTAGSPVVTCGGATCPNPDIIDYTLTQLGPYTASGFDGLVRYLPAPSSFGQTPNAPALFALQLNNGQAADTGNAYNVGATTNVIDINQFLRSDFVGAPLAGDYELDLWATQTQDLGQVTAVQLIVEPFFWSASTPVQAAQ